FTLAAFALAAVALAAVALAAVAPAAAAAARPPAVGRTPARRARGAGRRGGASPLRARLSAGRGRGLGLHRLLPRLRRVVGDVPAAALEDEGGSAPEPSHGTAAHLACLDRFIPDGLR